MGRKIVMSLTGVVLAFGMLGAATAFAAPQAVFGGQRCTFIGSEHFKPALTDGGTATGLTTRLFGTLSGCSGTTGVAGLTITGGALRASGTEATFSNHCAALTTEGVPGLHGSIKWKAGRVPVEPSTFDTSNGSAAIGAGITLESPSPGPTPSEGDSFISGSYGPSGSLGGTVDVMDVHLVADETPSQLAAACAARHGQAKLHFTGVHGSSSVSLLPHPPGTLTVTPSTGLVDGQPVTVTGDDWRAPGATIVQCPSDVGFEDGACGAQNRTDADADPVSEHFTGSLGVLRTQSRIDGNGMLDCSVPHSCVVAAFPELRSFQGRLVAPIEFADPAG